jgi:hypothetical protein
MSERPGLNRRDLVNLNRIQRAYHLTDVLPNEEQIRYDVGWLVGALARLNAQLAKGNRHKDGRLD